MIRAGKVSDSLSLDHRSNFFLSKRFMGNLPSTKIRSSFKRRRVIAIELEIAKRNFDISKFPLAKDIRNNV
jgi:hypothetical protein